MTSRTGINLCLASTHFFPARGGATLRFLRYVPGLQQRGINIRILTGTPKAKKSYGLDNRSEWDRSPGDLVLPGAALEGVPIERVHLPGTAGRMRSIAFCRAMLRFCQEPGYHPQVLQVVSSFQPRSLPWLWRLRKLGIKVVYAYTLAPQRPPNPVRRIFRQWGLRALYDQLDSLVVSTSVMKDFLLAVGSKTGITVIPNGVDLQRYRPAVDQSELAALRTRFGVKSNEQMVTAIGAVHPRKGSDLLLEAWVHVAKYFPGAHLFLVGLRKDHSYSDLTGFRQKIENCLTASGAPDRVHFPGFVENVEEYLRASDVFVFPSSREGMPNAVIEAMASGLPVILTPFKGLSNDFGRSGDEYLLVDRDSASLASAVSDVLENESLRKNLGHRARNWIENTMDLEKVLDDYAELYRSLVA
jgi:glycosyltransferase involved in cell wall biosynthesis